MSKSLIRGCFRTLKGLFCLCGAIAVLFTTLLATPLASLPELRSISVTARAVDRSTMPRFELFQARDGTELAYRHYPAGAAAVDRVAVLVHGSSGSSASVHALADA